MLAKEGQERKEGSGRDRPNPDPSDNWGENQPDGVRNPREIMEPPPPDGSKAPEERDPASH